MIDLQRVESAIEAAPVGQKAKAALRAMIPAPVPCHVAHHPAHCSPDCPFCGDDDQCGWCKLGCSLPIEDPRDEKIGDHRLLFYSYCRKPGPSCPAKEE